MGSNYKDSKVNFDTEIGGITRINISAKWCEKRPVDFAKEQF